MFDEIIPPDCSVIAQITSKGSISGMSALVGKKPVALAKLLPAHVADVFLLVLDLLTEMNFHFMRPRICNVVIFLEWAGCVSD